MKRNCHKLSPQMKWFTPCSIVDEVLAFSEQQYITCKQTTASTATRPIHLLEHPSLPFCFLMKTCIIHVSLILHISTQSLNTYLKHAVDIYQLEHDKVLKKIYSRLTACYLPKNGWPEKTDFTERRCGIESTKC